MARHKRKAQRGRSTAAAGQALAALRRRRQLTRRTRREVWRATLFKNVECGVAMAATAMQADRVCGEHSGKHHTTSGKNSFLIIPILCAFFDTDQREYAASLRIS